MGGLATGPPSPPTLGVPRQSLGTDLTAGVVFGGATLALMAPLPTTALVVRGLNEVIFPVGCSLVVYAASMQRAPERASALPAPEHAARIS